MTAPPMPAVSGTRAATPAGKCPAPETSHDDPIAAVIAATAVAGSRPRRRTVVSVSGAGSVLIVTSVMAASVPQEPATSLQRS